MDLAAEQRLDLLHERVRGPIPVPGLHLDTNKYRRGPSVEDNGAFRAQLLQNLQMTWGNKTTLIKFLELVRVIDNDGCALFGGLIDTGRFQ